MEWRLDVQHAAAINDRSPAPAPRRCAKRPRRSDKAPKNLLRAVSVSGHNPGLTAEQLVQRLAPAVAALPLPPGYRIDLGGEIEDTAQTNAALLQFLPLAMAAILLLFIWQLSSFRKLAIVVGSIPFVPIGAVLALLLATPAAGARRYPMPLMAAASINWARAGNKSGYSSNWYFDYI